MGSIKSAVSRRMFKKETATCLVLFSLIYFFLFPQYSWGYLSAYELVTVSSQSPLIFTATDIGSVLDKYSESLVFIQGHTLLQVSNPDAVVSAEAGPTCPVSMRRMVVITAYSSTPQETDSSPFITASGSHVRDGVIAANFLEFGTKVQIPQLYGDKIFVVEDRMALKNSHKVDIWMPSRSQALQFGVQRAEIVVLDS